LTFTRKVAVVLVLLVLLLDLARLLEVPQGQQLREEGGRALQGHPEAVVHDVFHAHEDHEHVHNN